MRERIEVIIATGATAGFTLAEIEAALKVTVLLLCAAYWLFKAALKLREVVKAWRDDHK